MILKLIFSIIISLAIILPVALPAQAQLGRALGNLDDAVGSGSGTGLKDNLAETIGTVVKGVLSLVGTVFLLLTIYAGILWMTARGAEDQVEKAKEIIRACVIGLFIVMSAYAITYFVGSKIGSAENKNVSPATVRCSDITDKSNCKNVTKCYWDDVAKSCLEVAR